ncbi:MaoC/PaaZ C-terminal domain-containing protein [Subtercola lobariae]|uniref:MaoC-like domain-containing protein n=1 Tax=Subtercola lobariae TaxID=1588641 RepID=A0A917BA67_9MICO|nr:MaoC/PaaZ C-terminal domain-containing protein [Subtercola lobariae]GGF33964.1 hypothetical protein GCM10011399_28920 [Subtercola lobariae]
MTYRLAAEELPVGTTIELGSYDVPLDEMVEFSKAWDPQPFHTDPDAAAAGFFGEIIGSGVYSMAVFQRLAVLGAYLSWDIVAGRSMRDVQLTSPVRAGAVLFADLTIDDVDFTYPDRALVKTTGRLRTDDALILTLSVDMYVRRSGANS